jgi:processive 1,2-diacylglycerol beta-glucosyltransferase
MVLSAAAGAGHVRAAEALVAAFQSRGISARHVEVLRYTNPLFKSFYSDLYIELVNRKPELLGWVYDALDRRSLSLPYVHTFFLLKYSST